MRNLLIIGMVIVAASMAGWFKIQRDGERTTIEINRGEIRSDAKQVIERGREFLDRRDREFAEGQTDQQLFSGQPQELQQDQLPSPQQQPPQQWETTYNPGQQPSGGTNYQQVQYNDAYQPYQPVQNQASQPTAASPYAQQQQQEYRR